MKIQKNDHIFSLTSIFAALLLAITINAKAAPANDSQILDVVKTANNAEISAAEVANTRASSPKVREFASHMLKEHKKNNSEADSVAKHANLKFESNDTSSTLKSDADAKLSELKGTPSTSRSFDKSYIDQQIAMHTSLLDNLNNNLIPTAQNSDVKKYLVETKTHVQRHLEEANKLLSDL
jgi:putative membrane protein